MTSIKDWQDSMREVDGWDEAVGYYIDEDDVEREVDRGQENGSAEVQECPGNDSYQRHNEKLSFL